MAEWIDDLVSEAVIWFFRLAALALFVVLPVVALIAVILWLFGVINGPTR